MAKDLKLGLNTGYWAGGPPPGIEDTIAEAERLGYDSIWTAEAYGSDVLTPLAWWGSKTENVRIGTAIMQMSARQPAAAAMAAMTMDSEVANKYFQGKENVPIAIARRRIKTSGDIKSALKLVPITKPVFEKYREMVERDYPHLVL